MLKTLLQTSQRNTNLYFQHSKNKSLLTNIIKRSAFFNFKQNEDKEKNNEDEIDSLKNIAYLIKQIKENNKKLPPLLPEKDIKDGDKLTVLMEMDEVLLYCFYPDEHEGYLQSPLRYELISGL